MKNIQVIKNIFILTIFFISYSNIFSQLKKDLKVHTSIFENKYPLLNNSKISINETLDNEIINNEILYKSLLRDSMIYKISPDTELIFYKKKKLQAFRNIPRDFVDFAKFTVKKENIHGLVGLIGISATLIYFDQQLLDNTHKFGNHLGIDSERQFKSLASINYGGENISVINIPDNFNTTLYWIGEGLPSLLLGVGIWVYGKRHNDYRALQTSSNLIEAFIVTGFTCQFIKHITGRQSPFLSTSPGGKWDFFPNQKEYMAHVPNYDAFPSGHMTTLMTTTMIIGENYPEHRYIKPIGYSIMALVGFSMMHNKVHWVSDYPLSIALGYVYGKIITSRNKKVVKKKLFGKNKYIKSSFLMPYYYGNSNLGLSLRLVL